MRSEASALAVELYLVGEVSTGPLGGVFSHGTRSNMRGWRMATVGTVMGSGPNDEDALRDLVTHLRHRLAFTASDVDRVKAFASKEEAKLRLRIARYAGMERRKALVSRLAAQADHWSRMQVELRSHPAMATKNHAP